MLETFAVIFGAIIGSFLSVCIYRIPLGRYDEDSLSESDGEPKPKEPISITSPARSFCPKCQTTLSWYHNIPIISWVCLQGKCSFCKEAIPFRYPLVELLSAIFCLLCLKSFGLTATGILTYAFCATLIVISFIDIDYYIIPNVISLPGTALGFAVGTLNGFYSIFKYPVSAGFMDSFYGVLVGAGFLFLVSEIYLRMRKLEGLGMGDVKLLAMTGAFFGPACALYTIFVGSLLGSIIGIVLVLVAGRKMTHQLPFGPYLAMGTLLFLFTDVALVNIISNFFVPATAQNF